MRLFVALEIPSDVRDNLAAFLNEMNKLSDNAAQQDVRWVRPENLHVTVKFIGEVADEKLDGIRAALAGVRHRAPLDIHFRDLGFFPDENRPAILWTAVMSTESLRSLAGEMDRTLLRQGIAKESRTFVPHLTLARFFPPGIHPRLLATIQKNGSRDFGTFQAHEFHLIESKLKPSGVKYSTLQSFRLGAGS